MFCFKFKQVKKITTNQSTNKYAFFALSTPIQCTYELQDKRNATNSILRDIAGVHTQGQSLIVQLIGGKSPFLLPCKTTISTQSVT